MNIPDAFIAAHLARKAQQRMLATYELPEEPAPGARPARQVPAHEPIARHAPAFRFLRRKRVRQAA